MDDCTDWPPGRYPPPIQRAIELNPDFCSYTVLPDAVLTDSFEANWVGLKVALEDASYGITLKCLMQSWPEDYEAPARTTLRSLLEWALKEGLIERSGDGNKRSPYCYALPGRKRTLFDRGFSFGDPPETGVKS